MMKVFKVADSHGDKRRDLVAFSPPMDFPHAAEMKLLLVKEGGVRLGNHSHPHPEGFFLVSGSCRARTWMQDIGVQEQDLEAPVMFVFAPHEEHALTCSPGMMLVGYSPVTFDEENNKPATHL